MRVKIPPCIGRTDVQKKNSEETVFHFKMHILLSVYVFLVPTCSLPNLVVRSVSGIPCLIITLT